MTDRELMQIVLKKLDHIWELGVEVGNYRLSDDLLPEIKALRERLAQPEREWVGLTDEEIAEIPFLELVEGIQSKLKEKNVG